MKITVEYAAQVKRATGVADEVLDVPDDVSLCKLGQIVADKHGEATQRVLMQDGSIHPSILVFINDQQARDTNQQLSDGQRVTFLSPISGG